MLPKTRLRIGPPSATVLTRYCAFVIPHISLYSDPTQRLKQGVCLYTNQGGIPAGLACPPVARKQP
jgi:hypothetical protein